MPPFLPVLGMDGHSVQQNSLRGQRLKPSSLGGSSTHATLDRTGSPARLESELSTPQEVAAKSKGRELEEENTRSSGGRDEENDRRDERDQERSKGSVELEKEDEITSAKVKEECCGGDEEEEEFKGCEESENASERKKSDRNGVKREGECFGEKQKEEASDDKESGHERSREGEKEQTDSEEEVVGTDAGRGGSSSDEEGKRCSFSEGELREREEEEEGTEEAQRCLERRGGETGTGTGSEIDEESAALKPQTAPEGESVSGAGSAGDPPAEADQRSDLGTLEQGRASPAGCLGAEVRISAACVRACSPAPALRARPHPCMRLRLLCPRG